MNPYTYAKAPRCPKCLNLHYADMTCPESARSIHMMNELNRLVGKVHRDRMQMIEDRFMAAVCAVCGDMPTLEHLQTMGKVFISPDGAMSLTWGSPDNVIASVPPPAIPCLSIPPPSYL